MSGDQGVPTSERPANAEPRPPSMDRTMRAVLLWVAGSAAALTAIALVAFGMRAAIGVGIGGGLATANLYVFARIGHAFLSRRGRSAPWAVIAVLKLCALLGGVWLILRSGLVSGLSLAVGYSALVLGITLGTLFGPRPEEDESERPPDGDGS